MVARNRSSLVGKSANTYGCATSTRRAIRPTEVPCSPVSANSRTAAPINSSRRLAAGTRGRGRASLGGSSAEAITIETTERGSGRVGGRRLGRTAVADWSGFLPLPHRTVHAVFPHTALRRSSPAAFSFPGAATACTAQSSPRRESAAVAVEPCREGPHRARLASSKRGREHFRSSARLCPQTVVPMDCSPGTHRRSRRAPICRQFLGASATVYRATASRSIPKETADAKSKSGRKGTQRKRLIAGMIDVANRNGYANASISAVTTAAGVSKPTFYEYFRRSRGLLCRCFDRHTRTRARRGQRCHYRPATRARNERRSRRDHPVCRRGA